MMNSFTWGDGRGCELRYPCTYYLLVWLNQGLKGKFELKSFKDWYTILNQHYLFLKDLIINFTSEIEIFISR